MPRLLNCLEGERSFGRRSLRSDSLRMTRTGRSLRSGSLRTTRQGWQMFENVRQPRRVALAVFSYVLLKPGETHPSPIRHFFWIWLRVVIPHTDEQVVELVLHETGSHALAINERRRHRELAVLDTHLGVQAPVRGREHRLVRSRMTAACVRPEPRRVILPGSASLKQNTFVAVEQHYRYRAVQPAVCVHVELSRHAKRCVLTIDENNEIVGRILRIDHDATRNADARLVDRRAPAARATLPAVVVIARREKLS